MHHEEEEQQRRSRDELQGLFRSRLGDGSGFAGLGGDEADDGYEIVDLEARKDRVMEASLRDSPAGGYCLWVEDSLRPGGGCLWTEGVALPATVACLIYSYVDYAQLMELRRVLPAPAAARVQSVLHNREYIRQCAYQGFDDPVDPEVRFRIWSEILRVPQMEAQYGPVLAGLVLDHQQSAPQPPPGVPFPQQQSGEAKDPAAEVEGARPPRSDFLLQQLLAIPTEADEYIEKDVPRTLIALHREVDSYVVHRALFRILHSYSVLDQQVMYCQGMNMVVGYFLRHLLPKNLPDSDEEFSFVDEQGAEVPKNQAPDVAQHTRLRLLWDVKEEPSVKRAEIQSFWLFAAVLHRLDHRQFYTAGIPGALRFQAVFSRLVSRFLPQLQRHFDTYDIHVSLLSGWWMTIFTFRHLPMNTLNRVWDVFVAEGVVGLHRVCLGLLSVLQPVLLALPPQQAEEQTMLYLASLPDSGLLQPEKVIAAARNFLITQELIDRIHRDISNPDGQ